LRFNNYDWISAKLSKKKDEEKEKSLCVGRKKRKLLFDPHS
jgi:hypothetical protein